jgi:hypothetical protein
MEVQVSERTYTDENVTQKLRPSGRVGNHFGGSKTRPAHARKNVNPRDILGIYQQLLDLQDQSEGELTRAILYGLKLLNDDDKKTKH